MSSPSGSVSLAAPSSLALAFLRLSKLDHTVFKSPRGRGTYGITVTPAGDVWYASLAGNHIAKIDTRTGNATVVEPPTPNQGARRVWSDSKGRIWVSEWNSGNLSMHDPANGSWKAWKLPGAGPRCYAVYVDEKDKVWLTDFMANAIVRFDPATEKFESFPSNKRGASVRQMLGRRGEAWGADYDERRRTGDWQYQWFWPDGKINTAENTARCASCHSSQASSDYLYTAYRIPRFNGKPVE